MANEPKKWQLPNNTHRVSIFGRTGSGKTQFGAFVLSEAPFDRQPYVIVDYKGDALLNSIDRAIEIGFNDVPRHPGLYVLHAEPDDGDDMERWLRNVWKTENVGLFFDEMYELPGKKAFRSILTQGRSKHIPAICLSQRPCWIPRFVISETDFIACFHLHDPKDRESVQRLMPQGALEKRLSDYSCHWYDVGRDILFQLSPAPDADAILNRIDDRLTPKRKFA